MINVSDFSLADWLHYLENRHSQEVQLGLPRIQHVAVQLNLLQTNAVVITVGGTNGKGSTVAALEAIYLAAGYQVASYTSPHLFVFNERIRINQQPITDKQLCQAFTAIEKASGSEQLTYFEMTTLAALWYFKQSMLDIILLEVGMGGRLDATNIIDADLAIITTVDLDHQDYLGDSIELIGHEKAGILRKDKPAIYADHNPPVSVLAQAALLNTRLVRLDQDYSFSRHQDSWIVIDGNNEFAELPIPKINLKAAAAAIVASACLNSLLPVNASDWEQAMKAVFIVGRQQLIAGACPTIFDVAHNPQAASLLADFIQQHYPKTQVHAVFSALKDKDLSGLIAPMSELVNHWYPAPLSSNRASSESLLRAAFLDTLNVDPVCFNTPLDAYQAAKKQAKPGDLIIVYGSFLLVAEIMAASENHVKQESDSEICYR